jgi:hypothetical protein
LPILIDSQVLEPFGPQHAGLRAASVFSDRFVAGAAPGHPYDGRGIWMDVPILRDHFGDIEMTEASQVPAAFVAAPEGVWIAMNDGYSDFGRLTLDPYVPTIAFGEDAGPTGQHETMWTGWDWQTIDLVALGPYVHTLTLDYYDDTLDLVTFDVTHGRLPRRVASLEDVCRIDAESMGDWYEFHRACSVAALDNRRLVVSSRNGAALLDVSAPERPVMTGRLDSLGTQLSRVPEGLVALQPKEPWEGGDEVVGYALDDAGMPTRRWQRRIGWEVGEFAVDSRSGLVAATTGSGPGVWAARATGTGLEQVTTLRATSFVFGLASYEDRLFWLESGSDPRLRLAVYALSDSGLKAVGSAPFDTGDDWSDGSWTRATVFGGIYAVGSWNELVLADVRRTDAPVMLGRRAYANGLCELSQEWCDMAQPALMAGVGRYLFVTNHPLGEVWR